MKHRVTFVPQTRTTLTPDGATLWSAASWAGLPMESACGGRGACGQCRVRVVEGAGPATEADRRFLSAAKLQEGWRLACRAAIHADCRVEGLRALAAPKAAPPGGGRAAALCPNVAKLYVRPPTPSAGDLRSDLTRLAAALRDAGYEVRAVPAVWRALPGLLRHGDGSLTATLCGDEAIAVEPGDTRSRNFGLALDIGTTTVAGMIVNLNTGAVEAAESFLNRQAAFGADVISRISYAASHEGGLAVLSEAIAATVNELVDQMTLRCGVAREELYEAVAVGNATMLHLLLGIDPAPIGVSPFIPVVRDAVTLPAAEAGLRLHPDARVSTLPHLGAYVGADIVAGLLATDVMRRADGKLRLYLDVGTNSEIVLGEGDRWLATAAPAGPAFEGAQIRCGMRASTGAIEHVEIAEDVIVHVVGGGRPEGICGSGLIDAVAALRQCGLVDPSGRLVRPAAVRGRLPSAVVERLVGQDGVAGFRLGSREDGIILTQADVRALQLAKAALASGIRVLLARMEAGPEDLQEVLLAGAFGSYLNPASARAIGLVPGVPLERIRAVGNAAGEGARIALVSRHEREAAGQMPQYVEYVELSGHPAFDHLFTESLAFPEL